MNSRWVWRRYLTNISFLNQDRSLFPSHPTNCKPGMGQIPLSYWYWYVQVWLSLRLLVPILSPGFDKDATKPPTTALCFDNVGYGCFSIIEIWCWRCSSTANVKASFTPRAYICSDYQQNDIIQAEFRLLLSWNRTSLLSKRLHPIYLQGTRPAEYKSSPKTARRRQWLVMRSANSILGGKSE